MAGYTGRRPYRPARPSGPRANMRAQACASCGAEVPAGAGILRGNAADGWTVTHAPQEWRGSPTSGGYAGGCPVAPVDTNGAAVAVGTLVTCLATYVGCPRGGEVTHVSGDGKWCTVTAPDGNRGTMPTARVRVAESAS